MARTMSSLTHQIDAVRHFSRFWTRRIELLSDGILESEFSLTEARVLWELAHSEDATPSRIAADLGLDPGYVSRVVKRLDRKGLVGRSASSEDRRVTLLRLTKEGKSAFRALNSGSRRQIERILKEASPEGRERAVDAMRAIEAELGESAMPPRVIYRTHQPGDMGWIVQRHGELYHASHGWDETFEAMVAGIVEKFIVTYDPAWERSWIAEVDGRRAGAIALVRHSKTIGQLRLLFVEPWARGLGIGARLVSECVGQARHVGYRKMILFTVAGLDAARRLYEAEGFRLVEEKPGHAWGKDHMEQAWELKL